MVKQVIVRYSRADGSDGVSVFIERDPDPDKILADYKAAGFTVESLTIYHDAEEGQPCSA